MSKYITAAIIALTFAACTKSETKIETSENPDGTVTTTTVQTEKTTGLDSIAINNTVEQAREKINKAGDKIEKVADKAGTELQKAGEDVKVAAEKGADKVERGADKVEADLKKK